MDYNEILERLEAISIKLQSYTDYPQAATNNAKRARKWKEENGITCGTPIGWRRSSQIADRKPISRETIAWGGSSMINWAINKLKQIDKK